MGRRPRFPDEGPPPALDPWIVGRPEVAVVRVALVNAPLLSAVCDHGVGHQMPPGLLMVGGALRGRAAVTLIDAARDHLTDDDIVRRVDAWGADVAMVAHVGSTQAHPCCLRTMAALKAALPGIVTVYGGVHPTYHAAGLSHSSN
jgi:anaerobic magnesium-protoporphyrin IX monomethyl ester cyclase